MTRRRSRHDSDELLTPAKAPPREPETGKVDKSFHRTVVLGVVLSLLSLSCFVFVDLTHDVCCCCFAHFCAIGFAIGVAYLPSKLS